MIESGTILSDRYRVERELGAGGMATVYLAHDIRHRRQVAVKVLAAGAAAGLAVDRFRREVEIVAPLLHPHILGLIDSGEHDAAPFYVMPYVEGESLRSHLQRSGQVEVDVAVRVLREVLDALAYAHTRGIVHRDIKPENVLLTSGISPGASGWHALVADFGIAKAIEAARVSGADGLTQLGTLLGTPGYMAPEQVAADPAIDHRADIYAVGVLGYELLAGRPPFDAPTVQQVMAAHLLQPPPPLRQRRAGVPAALEQFVLRCLAKDPGLRYQSAGDALGVLNAVPAGADSIAVAAMAPPRVLSERRFVLDEAVCRRLDRSRLDPRIIGDSMTWLDNGLESDVLVCFLHGTGLDYRQAERYLRELPYRAIAPTLFGFEPDRRKRIPIVLEDHFVLLRALLTHVRGDVAPERCVLVGLSSGADVALRMTAATLDDTERKIGAVLALGCNVSYETTFATRLFAQLGNTASDGLLRDLQRLGSALPSLDDWINVHGYLVDTIRKLREDVSAVRQFANDIIQPLADATSRGAPLEPLITWYRSAAENASRVRCVFEDDPVCERAVAAMRMAHLDAGTLGPRYRADDLVIEPGTTHFDLFHPDVVYRHLTAVVIDQAESLSVRPPR